MEWNAGWFLSRNYKPLKKLGNYAPIYLARAGVGRLAAAGTSFYWGVSTELSEVISEGFSLIPETNCQTLSSQYASYAFLTSLKSQYQAQYTLLVNFSCDEDACKPLKQKVVCLLYTSPSPRDRTRSRMPSSA